MSNEYMVSTRYPVIEQAIGNVTAEKKILTAERDALTAFLDRITEIRINQSSGLHCNLKSATNRVIAPSRPSDNLQAVRTAYRETIMNVPHYDDEYDEPLKVHLMKELNEEVARQLLEGTALTEPLYAALIGTVKQRRTSRNSLLRTLDKERDSLQSVVDSLAEIETQAHEIGDQIGTATNSAQRETFRTNLVQLEDRCEEVATTRQTTIHQRSGTDWAGVDSDSLVAYLYHDLKTTTPALSAIAQCIETIRRHHRLCLQ